LTSYESKSLKIDRFKFWLAGSYRRRNRTCQILWQLVQGFRSSDTPNYPFSIGIAGRPYDSVSITVLHRGAADFQRLTSELYAAAIAMNSEVTSLSAICTNVLLNNNVCILYCLA